MIITFLICRYILVNRKQKNNTPGEVNCENNINIYLRAY